MPRFSYEVSHFQAEEGVAEFKWAITLYWLRAAQAQKLSVHSSAALNKGVWYT